MVGCSSLSPVSLEDETQTLERDDVVTASKEFTLSRVRSSSSLLPQDLPAGLSLTVQLLTTKSGAKKGNRYARVKLTNGSSAEIPLPPLTTTLETRGPNATLSGSVSKSLKSLPVGKTAYRSVKSVPVSSANYAQLCGVATFAGVITPVPLEVCEAGTGTATPAQITRALLEPLAVALNPSPTPDSTAWSWTQSEGEESIPALVTLPFDEWLTYQPQTPALAAFALEMKRQFADLTVYLDEVPCHNCHQFTTTITGRAVWGLGGFTSSEFWDS